MRQTPPYAMHVPADTCAVVLFATAVWRQLRAGGVQVHAPLGASYSTIPMRHSALPTGAVRVHPVTLRQLRLMLSEHDFTEEGALRCASCLCAALVHVAPPGFCG